MTSAKQAREAMLNEIRGDSHFPAGHIPIVKPTPKGAQKVREDINHPDSGMSAAEVRLRGIHGGRVPPGMRQDSQRVYRED